MRSRTVNVTGYDLPKGATAVRILYHSRALNGDDIAVSGVVLIPGGEPPPGGWPLIAWAHGTSGVAPMCAPSLMKDVEYGDEGLMPMVAAGFAVAGYMDTEAWASEGVAPDPETAMYWPMEAFGIKVSYPSFDVARMLTPAGLSVYEEITTKGCYYRDYFVAKALGPKPLAYPNWAAAPEARHYLQDSQSADKPIAGPLLEIAGDDDKSVLFPSLRRSVTHACHIGLPIEFRHRAGLDHDPLMYQMTPEILRWARARLDHEPWTGNCPTTSPGAGKP